MNFGTVTECRIHRDWRSLGFDNLTIGKPPFHSRMQRRPFRKDDFVRCYAQLFRGASLDRVHGFERRFITCVAINSGGAAASDSGVFDASLGIELLGLDLAQRNFELLRDNFTQYSVS